MGQLQRRKAICRRAIPPAKASTKIWSLPLPTQEICREGASCRGQGNLQGVLSQEKASTELRSLPLPAQKIFRGKPVTKGKKAILRGFLLNHKYQHSSGRCRSLRRRDSPRGKGQQSFGRCAHYASSLQGRARLQKPRQSSGGSFASKSLYRAPVAAAPCARNLQG